MERVYPTKVDWWIGLLVLGGGVIMIGSALVMIFTPGLAVEARYGFAALMVVIALWTIGIPFNTRYIVGEDELVVRSAGFSWRVPTHSIQSVTPTLNPLSGPACSLDRLHVQYVNTRGRNRFVLISPRDKADFIRDLAEVVPGAHVEHDRLVVHS